MATNDNPNVDDRSNTAFYTGPIGNPTVLSGPVYVVADSLPTADPQVAGQLWSNSGVLTVSAG